MKNKFKDSIDNANVLNKHLICVYNELDVTHVFSNLIQMHEIIVEIE